MRHNGKWLHHLWVILWQFIYSETCIKRTPSIKRTRRPKKYLKWSFLLLPTCIKRTLVIKSITQHARRRKSERLPPSIFSIFTLKNVTWRTYLSLISFTVQYSSLFRFVSIELVSLIWFPQIWVVTYVFGTMINWSTLIKKLMQTKRL